MTPEDQATVRARALQVIAAYRDGGCVLPPPPPAGTVLTMMRHLVASDVPEEYVPLLLEELELDGSDGRDLHWVDDVPDERRAGFHVVVIGAGMSGLLAAIRLGRAGIPFTVVEKNAGAGGTWWENRYPGCRVDIGNHFYCYSFAPERVDGVLRRGARAARLLRRGACTTSGWPTTSGSAPRWSGRPGTRRRPVVGGGPDPRRHRSRRWRPTP